MICSALVYQYLVTEHGNEKNVIKIFACEAYIGLLGKRDEFEAFHSIPFLRLRNILHEAYRRVYQPLPKNTTLFVQEPFCRTHHRLFVLPPRLPNMLKQYRTHPSCSLRQVCVGVYFCTRSGYLVPLLGHLLNLGLQGYVKCIHLVSLRCPDIGFLVCLSIRCYIFSCDVLFSTVVVGTQP